MELIGDPDTPASKLAEVLETDPSLSVQILRLANSAMCGCTREVQSIRHAVVVIGLEKIKNLVLAASLSNNLSGSIPAQQLSRFWQHSFGCAFLCQTLTRLLIRRGQDLSYLAGLLHDIGRLLIHSQSLEKYPRIMSVAVEKKMPLRTVEEMAFGQSHATVGAMAMEKWKISSELAGVVRDHHGKMEDPEIHFLSPVVNLADALCRSSGLAYIEGEFVDREVEVVKPWFSLWRQYGEPKGLTIDTINEELKKQIQKIRETAASFSKREETRSPGSTKGIVGRNSKPVDAPDVYVIDAD
jgi:putative nucleotidyltransferase with HDIG domain